MLKTDRYMIDGNTAWIKYGETTIEIKVRLPKGVLFEDFIRWHHEHNATVDILRITNNQALPGSENAG